MRNLFSNLITRLDAWALDWTAPAGLGSRWAAKVMPLVLVGSIVAFSIAPEPYDKVLLIGGLTICIFAPVWKKMRRL